MQFGYTPSGAITPSWCDQILPVTHFWNCTSAHQEERVLFIKPSGHLALGVIVALELASAHYPETLWKVRRRNSLFFIPNENIGKSFITVQSGTSLALAVICPIACISSR